MTLQHAGNDLTSGQKTEFLADFVVIGGHYVHCERAVMELARNEYVLGLRRVSLGLAVQDSPSDLFERRCLFFSTAEGHAMFRERLGRKITGPRFTSEVICDAEIEGPWTEYASVWRVLIRPSSTEFLLDTERYFFW